MPTHTREAIDERMRAVELTWASGQWTMASIAALANKHDVSTRQIQLDRAKIEQHHREALAPMMGDKAAAKSELLARARLLFAESLKRNHTITCAKLLDFEARVTGALAPLEVRLLNDVKAMDDVALARTILDPDARAWARARLIEAGELNVLEVADAK